MRTLLSPKWVLLINTLPVILLSILYVKDYNVIHSLLDAHSRSFWHSYGLLLTLLTLINTAYCITAARRKKLLTLSYGCASLLVYLAFSYFYLYHATILFPPQLPNWMVSGITALYTGTFLMPTMVHALIIVMIYCTRHIQKRNAWPSFGAAIAAPSLAYLFIQALLPTWSRNTSGNRMIEHAINVIYIALVVIFLFFLFRFLYILLCKKEKWFLTTRTIWFFLIGILFPVIGLCVNKKENNFFGNFSDPWFFILAILNGVLLCLPETGSRRYLLFLFSGRCFTLCYTLYFFFVFLPFLPLSVIAIIAYGAGFLMLTPPALFCIHIHKLMQQYKALQQECSWLAIKGIALFMIIPVILFSSLVYERINLHKALEYVYNPDLSKTYSISSNTLSATLNAIDKNRRPDPLAITGEAQPYLSSFYNWAVLDNLSLTETKSHQLRQIFLGDSSMHVSKATLNRSAVLTNLTADSHYDSNAGAWLSTVAIELSNTTTATGEYETSIRLPAGCFVSNYYLYVGNRKEQGILAEKRTAQWVFNQIRNERRDPGILYYKNPDELTLKVFPFTSKEIRKTGIEFLHKDPVTLTIDGHTIQLGDIAAPPPLLPAAAMGPIYLTASEKKRLPRVFRKPYYHFLVDVSAASAPYIRQQAKTVDSLITILGLPARRGQVSLVNSQVHTFKTGGQWKNMLHHMHRDGGFFLERALQQSLTQAYLSNKTQYPVFIVVTNHLTQAILNPERKALAFSFPEKGNYFVAAGTEKVMAFSLLDNTPDTLSNGIHRNTAPVLAYPDLTRPTDYLNTDDTPAIIINKDHTTNDHPFKKDWASALALYANTQQMQRYPILQKKGWLQDVRHSFQSGILTPNTAYIVVENEAQKSALYQKQKEVIAGNKNLDVDDESSAMSEPGLLVLFLFLLLLLLRNRSKLRYAFSQSNSTKQFHHEKI
ncbi:MSEP-CTERM sorting domain-containing protein [Niabella pedocola]|uniref:MSEP-CTERM sorting domain-containing protein n=1 Tax=Niabella pedocola TaxID=1752077 RepID=A0ABS8PYL3_9BACT|nr:MSEP-CTERM sorting domain-containing protein [Niabella pedocola]MCD2426157.1 MSEP-CTERM sorting domain-containing protein [Niabella pedocola]